MKYLPTLLLGAWMLAGTAIVHADKTVTTDAALEAIDTFQKNPAGKEGFAAGETILAFAQKSPAVHLSLSKTIVPWVKRGDDVPDADTRHMLLIAYIAGNVRAQMKNGKAADDIYAGWEQVLNTYAQLLQINPAAKISEVDDLKKMEANGKLRAHAAEVQTE